MAQGKTISVPALEGSKITKFRKLTSKEKDSFCLEDDNAGCLELDSGVNLFIMADDEGNGFGRLIGSFKGDEFRLWPK